MVKKIQTEGKSLISRFLGKFRIETVLLVILCLLLIISITNNGNIPRPYSTYAMNDVMDGAYAKGMAMTMPESSRSFATESAFYDDSGSEYGEKIDKRGYIHVEVEPNVYDQKITQARSTLLSFKGYIHNENEYTNIYNEKKYRTTSFTIKVPVESFDSLYTELKGFGEIQSANFYLNDKTSQYYDVKAYYEQYVAQKDKILSLLDRAEDIKDVLEIEKHLTEIQMNIDRYQRQLNSIEKVTDYSTITFTVNEKIPVSSQLYIVKGKEIAQGFVNSFNNAILFVMKNFVLLVLIGITSVVVIKRRKHIK